MEAQREEEERRQWEVMQEELEREEEERHRARAERRRQKIERDEARESARQFAEAGRAYKRAEARWHGATPSPKAPSTSRRAAGAGVGGTSPKMPRGPTAQSSSMPSPGPRKCDAIAQAQAAALQQLRTLKLMPTQEAKQ